MKLWVRKLLLLPLYPILTLLMLFGLVLILIGEKTKKTMDKALEKPPKPEGKCKTVHVGKYVVCKNCDFKEYA